MAPFSGSGRTSRLPTVVPTVVPTVAVVVLVLVLGACGGSEDPEAGASESPTTAASTPTPSPSPTPTEEPTPTPEAASPTPTPTPTSDSPSPSPSPAQVAAGSLRAALLTSEQLPGLNAESAWRQGGTRAVGADSFGACQRFDALTIGALRGVQRGHLSGADRAGQQVLAFPDAQNAVRAARVFEGWHRDCRSQVPGSSAQVRPLQSLSTDADAAWWYLVSWERGDVGRWEAFGLARSGARLTVLRMAHEGQDHSYAPGEDPLERALVTAASMLG